MSYCTGEGNNQYSVEVSFTVTYHITICKPVSSLHSYIIKSNVKQRDMRQPCQNDCQQFQKDIDQTEI